jgi:aldose 1-epimerase
VEHATPDELALALRHDSPDAVFRYRAEQVFSLRPDRLELELAVTHLGQEPLPYGVGLHPYLNRAGALLSAEVQDVWLPDAANIPHELVPVPSEWSFRLRRPVAELTLDHNFTGWQGVARVDWPEAGESLLIEADPLFGHLVVYIPHGQPFFCVEPVSHAANAINRLGEGIGSTGLRVLEPGERLVGSIRLSVPGG